MKSKNHTLFLSAPAACVLALGFAVPAFGQSLLVDFGASSTTGADANGNYWNNFTVGGSVLSNMVTSSNGTTAYGLAFTTGVGINTFGTPFVASNPSLGVFNISTVYLDGANATGAATGSLNLTGLNSFQTYDFLLLGTRNATDTRTTTYTVTGSNSATGNDVTSGTNVGGTGINYNVTPLSLTGITPNGSSIISVSYTNPTAASFSYLNAMQFIGYVPYRDGATHTLSTAMSYPGNTILGSSTTVNSGGVAGALGSGTSSLEMGTGGGTLVLGANETVKSLIGSGNLALTTSASTLTINTAGATTFSVQTGSVVNNDYTGILSGTGTIDKKTGSGNQTLSGANTFSGTFKISDGTLTLNNVNALQNAKLDTIYGGGGTVAFGLAGSNTYNVGGILGNRAIAMGANSLNVSTANGNSFYDGALSGSGSLTKSGAGIFTFRGDHTFTGSVTIAAGTLQVSDDGPANGGNIGTTSGITNNGTLVYNLSVVDRTYANAIGGTGALLKIGAKSLTLSGTNTYSGSTSVTGGKLSIDTAGTINTTSGVSIGAGEFNYNNSTTALSQNVSFSGSGGTLSGTGTITPSVTVTTGNRQTSGTSVTAINPTAGLGKQTFGTGITYNSGSIFEWNLTANTATSIGTRGTDYDAVNTANLGATTGAFFQVILDGSQNFSESFWDSDRTWAGLFKNLAESSAYDLSSIFNGGFEYRNSAGTVSGVPTAQGAFSFVNGGTDLKWSAVPEPSSALAGLLLTAGLLRRRRVA